MKICFFETQKEERDFFSAQLAQDDLSFFEDALTEETQEIVLETEVISVFIYSKLTAKVLKKFPNLRLIVTRSTGFDHIDLEYCRANKIKVSNVPNYGENTVAEHTFALILALSRQILPSVDRTRHGEFSSENLSGFDLFGKTLGILGTGRIGARVAEIGYGFGMKILAFDKAKKPELIKKFKVKYCSLAHLLANSDIISLHLRHTAETHHFLSDAEMQKIKKGAYLINTARGGLIDTHALLGALEDKTLAGAGLDVLEEECSIKEDMGLISKQFPKKCLMINIANNILSRKPNVIITPHNAFNSIEAFKRIEETTVENIKAFKAQKPINIV